MEKSDHARSSALAFLIGGTVGAAAALLLAPRSGAVTCHRIAQDAQNLQTSGETFAHDMEDKAEAVGGAIKNAMSEAQGAYESERERNRDSARNETAHDAEPEASANDEATDSHA